MDKEKEVKRYEYIPDYDSDIKVCKNGDWVKFTDHEEALKAERTKREDAENQVEHWKSHYYNDDEKGRKIKELEAKVKELEKELETRKISIDEIMSRRVLVEELESQLATANAKIVELEGQDRIILFSRLCLALFGNQTAIPISCEDVVLKVEELKAELAIANKKAEKLVDGLEGIKVYIENAELPDDTLFSGHVLSLVEQAIKEFRGGE